MPKYSVKKPFTILVAVILVLVLGFVSLTGIQTDLLPAMNLPYLMVITTYPGASPEQVEADVTKPLENALSTLNGVKNVTSQSNENYSLLFLEYQDDTDMDSAMVKASTAVNQLGDALPDMASTPTLMEISPDMMATQYIAVDYDGMDIYELSDYVSENVLPQLERVDGVASVSTTGLVEKSVQITLDQEKIDAVNDKLLVKVSDRLADAKKELDANKKKINDGMKELDAAQAQLDAGKAQLNSQKADVTTQLRDAITELDKQIPELEKKIAYLVSLLEDPEKLKGVLKDELLAIADKYGNYWHASTMRISVNHDFERRVGLFPAGFDKDGVLYCNQNFADYPHEIPAGKFDAASQQPKWMLLSYRKTVTASSTAEGSDPANAVDEDCRRWWSAGSDQPGEWLCVDLGRDCDVRAVQVNMADEALAVDFPADSYGDDRKTRHIETRPQISHYTVETSLDGKVWTLREDVARECSNGYYEYADGIRARYIRVTGGELPYGQALRISGLRVFGNGKGDRPAQANAKAVRVNALDGKISWQHIENAQGCNVRYGIAPDKLYQSWLVYDADEVTLSTLMAGQTYYVCVDSFNENGITTGRIIKMEG